MVYSEQMSRVYKNSEFSDTEEDKLQDVVEAQMSDDAIDDFHEEADLRNDENVKSSGKDFTD